MLDNWSAIQEILESALKQLAAFSTDLSTTVVIACLVLPVVVALISRRVLTVLAVVLLATASLVALLQPAFIATMLALASYCGSVLVALLGICSWRKDRAVRAELAALRLDIDQLVQAESRRMMVELRSTKDAVTPLDQQAAQ